MARSLSRARPPFLPRAATRVDVPPSACLVSQRRAPRARPSPTRGRAGACFPFSRAGAWERRRRVLGRAASCFRRRASACAPAGTCGGGGSTPCPAPRRRSLLSLSSWSCGDGSRISLMTNGGDHFLACFYALCVPSLFKTCPFYPPSQRPAGCCSRVFGVS